MKGYKMPSVFKDFNLIIPEKRIAKIGEYEIDVSKVPSRTSLEMAIFRDTALQMTSEQQVKTSVEIVAKVCQKSNPEITADWLIDNTDYEQLLEFIDFVLEPINHPGKKKVSQ